MKLKVYSQNGNAATIDLAIADAAGLGGLATASGMPTGTPGVAALQVLQGWGHGATAGLGGADWSAGCGTYRGEAYRVGPSFDDTSDEDACKVAGISTLCSPSNPRGVWLFPWTYTLAGGETAIHRLTLPSSGRLFALEALVYDPANPTDDASNDLKIGSWASRQITNTYPGAGRDTTVSVGSTPPVNYNPNVEQISTKFYTRQRLLDGQNFLPPWVPSVDLKNGNDELTWSVINTLGSTPADARVVELVLHLSYGSFDMRSAMAAAKACAC